MMTMMRRHLHSSCKRAKKRRKNNQRGRQRRDDEKKDQGNKWAGRQLSHSNKSTNLTVPQQLGQHLLQTAFKETPCTPCSSLVPKLYFSVPLFSTLPMVITLHTRNNKVLKSIFFADFADLSVQ